MEAIQVELNIVSRRETDSILKKRDFHGLSTWNFASVVEEMRRLCPTVYQILSTMLELEIDPEKRTPTLALIYGLIMFRRFHELSMFQRVNTLVLIDGKANQEVMSKY